MRPGTTGERKEKIGHDARDLRATLLNEGTIEVLG
jgi:hypothetical protein